MQISGGNLPAAGTTFKLLQQIPWGFTIQNQSDQAYPGGDAFLAYVTGRDIYGNQIYIEVARGFIPAIRENGTVNIDNRNWTIPNDGTLYNMDAPGYSFVVSIFPQGQPTTLPQITAAAGNPFLSRSGNFLIDVIPDLAVAAPGVTYLPRDYGGGDVINFTTTWGNRTVGERPLSSRPLRAGRDNYSVDLRITENAAFNVPPDPSPSPTPTPPPTGDPEDAPAATDTINDDFKLMAIIFGGDLAGIAPDGSSQFRRVQVVGTPGPVAPYGITGILPIPPALNNPTQRNYTPQPDDGFLDIGEGVVLTSEQLVPRNFEGDYFVAMRLQTASDARVGNNVFVSNAANKVSISATSDPALEPASAVSTQTGVFVQGGNGGSSDGGISDEGTVVFSSTASNLLVPPTQAGTTVPPQFGTTGRQIFLKLRDTREVFLASRTVAGVQANADCFDPFISANGRYVAFHSKASNLVNENTGSRSMIYVYDTTTRQTVVVSRNALGALANGDSFNASLSASGRFVAFESVASNLDAPIVQPVISASGPTIGQIRSYVVVSGGSGYKAGATFEVTLLGGTGSGARGRATVGSDGSVLAVTPIGTNYGGGYQVSNPPTVVVPSSPQVYPPLAGQGQVYLHDRNVDGRVDTNGNPLFDAVGNTRTYLVSVGLNALDELATISDNLSFEPAVNANDSTDDLSANGGMFVAFSSYASNMPGASSGRAMVYRAQVDVANAVGVVAMQPVSVNNAGAAGVVATAPGVVPFNLQPSISGDGSQVAFTSFSANLVYNDDSGAYDADTNGVQDVFVRNFRIPADNDLNRATVRVSVSEEKVATGTIFFEAVTPLPLPPTGDNVPNSQPTAGDTITISTGTVSHSFVFDGASGPAQTAVTIGASILETRDNLLTAIALSPLRSGNPRIEAFATTPPNDAAGLGTAYTAGIYLKNTSRGSGGNVAILVNGVPINPAVGGGAAANIFGSGMSGGGTQAEDNPRAVQGVPFGSNEPSIDRSGRYVAFRTIAGNLDVYLSESPRVFTDPADPITGELIRPLLTPGSAASNVYFHDRNARDIRDADDLPVYDLPFDPATNKEFVSTRRVSVNRFGYPTYVTGTQESGVNANSSANSSDPLLSPNGRYVVFTSTAPGEGGLIFGPNNLTPLDGASFPDVFIADLGTLGGSPPPVDSRPTVTILSPQADLVVSPQTIIPVYINAQSKGEKQIASAELFVNNVSQGKLAAEPFEWNYTVPATGNFVFRVVVEDSKGLTREASVLVISDRPGAGAPLVQISQPVNTGSAQNFVAGSAFFLNASTSATPPAAIDPKSIRFTVNGVPIADELGQLGDNFGAYLNPTIADTVVNLRATGKDTEGRGAFSAPIAMRIGQLRTSLPTVFVRPIVQASKVAAGSTVQLQAEALFPPNVELLGGPAPAPQVEFYVNKVYVGTATAAGPAAGGRTLYNFNWEIPEIVDSLTGPRIFSVQARAVALNWREEIAPAVFRSFFGSSVSARTPLSVYYVPTSPALGSNEAFIIDNFEKLFFREPDFSDYQEYLDLFAAGFSQAQVVDAMLRSSEFGNFQQILFGYYLRMGLAPSSQAQVLNFVDVMRSANGRTLLPAIPAVVPADATKQATPYGATLGQAQVASALISTPTLTNTNGVPVRQLSDQAFRDWMIRTFNTPYLPAAFPTNQTIAFQGDQSLMLSNLSGPYPAAGATDLQQFGANYAHLSATYASLYEDRMNPSLRSAFTNFPGLVRGVAFQYLYKGTWGTNAPAATPTVISNSLVPGITSAGAVNGRVSNTITYQITTVNAAPVGPYRQTNLPPGLVLNSNTGLITGLPTAEGVFQSLLSVANANGTNTKQVTFTVVAPAPQITNQAINANVGDGIQYRIVSTPDPNVYPTTYTLTGGINKVRVTAPGVGYASAPSVTFSGGGGSGAAATAVLGTGADLGKVVAVNIVNPGSGYTSNPQITLSGGGGGTGARASAFVLPDQLSFNKAGGLISGSLAEGSEGNYSLKMTVQNSGGSATADLAINVTLPSAMTKWLASSGITTRSLNLGTDSDGDGESFYDEFSFGTDPTKRDRNPWTMTRVPGKVTIQWMGRKDGSVDYTIERSDAIDSTTWSPMSIVSPPAGVVVTRPTGPAHNTEPAAYEWIRVEIPILSNQQSGFYKVKASIKPSALPPPAP